MIAYYSGIKEAAFKANRKLGDSGLVIVTFFIRLVIPLCLSLLSQIFAGDSGESGPLLLKDPGIEAENETGESVKGSFKKSLVKKDTGIAKSIAIGVKGLFALGSVEDAQKPDVCQSPVGFSLFFLFPLTEKTHLRVKAGIPLWHVNGTSVSEDEDIWDDGYYVKVTKDKKYVDPYVSVEHAWGWKKIGFSLGLSYMMAQRFTRDILELLSVS